MFKRLLVFVFMLAFVSIAQARITSVFTFPAGSDQGVQFNDNGIFGSSDTFRFEKSSGTLYITNIQFGDDTVQSTSGEGFTIKETDDNPTVTNVTTIRVSTGTLVDNGSGIVTLDTGGGSGGGSPSGADTYVQFNDVLAFGGVAFFTYDKINHLLSVDGSTHTTALELRNDGTGNQSFNTMLTMKNDAAAAKDNSVAVTFEMKGGGGGGLVQFGRLRAIVTDSGANEDGDFLIEIKRAGQTEPILWMRGIEGDVSIGTGTAGVDYSLTFQGEDRVGSITWLEDEANFQLSHASGTSIDLVLESTTSSTYGTIQFTRNGTSQADIRAAQTVFQIFTSTTGADGSLLNRINIDASSGDIDFNVFGDQSLTVSDGTMTFVNGNFAGSLAPKFTWESEATLDIDAKVSISSNAFDIAGIPYIWPPDDGDASEVLGTDGSGALTWVAGGTGVLGSTVSISELDSDGLTSAVTGFIVIVSTDDADRFSFREPITTGSTTTWTGTNTFDELVDKSSQCFNVTITSGTTWGSLAIPVWDASYAVTLRSTRGTVIGGTSLAWNLEERSFGSMASSGTDIFASDQAADTTGEIDTTFSNSAIDQFDHLVFTTGASPDVGDVELIKLNVCYTRD